MDTPVRGFNARTDYLNQRFFIAARNHIMPPLRQQQSELWYYQFDWDEQPVPWNDIYGAAHLFDIPFMFGNFGPSLFGQVAFSSANKPGRLALSAAMMASVAAFARSGDPNTPALGARWTPWPSVLHFDATKTSKAISLVP